jgi:formylglycine-generating enzyme
VILAGAAEACGEGTRAPGSTPSAIGGADDGAGGGDSPAGAAAAPGGEDPGAGAGGVDNAGGADSAAAGAGGASESDACIGNPCNTPPAASCANSGELITYDAVGSCKDGVCSYTEHDIACTCESDACTTDPCADVTCGSPPTSNCEDSQTRVTYAVSGTCSAGSCSYAPTEVACSGGTPLCKAAGATSTCVQCLSNEDCGGTTPLCNKTGNVCESFPSCVGLPKTCGPAGDADCCAANLVAGDTFNRGNDQTYPAIVADFRLDNYEITVGRFRKFVGAYSQAMIKKGAGKNPNDASDAGWDWNASLPADAAALKSALKCSTSFQTWTDAAGTPATESLPINCITWFEAAAFCIWDGGRLPTEAEWNYAAAGGKEQRSYPWGTTTPNCNYANFGLNCVTGAGGTNRVGSESPVGDGLYGQSDLAGNVWEWVQDWYWNYQSSCDNCSGPPFPPEPPYRVIRGGSFGSNAAALLTSHRLNLGPSEVGHGYGARCARAP